MSTCTPIPATNAPAPAIATASPGLIAHNFVSISACPTEDGTLNFALSGFVMGSWMWDDIMRRETAVLIKRNEIMLDGC